MDNNTTITNTNDRQNGDTTITVEEVIDGNTAYSSVRYFGDGVITHTTAINGVVVSSGPGHPATGPLTETGIQSGIYWKRNIVSRFYH